MKLIHKANKKLPSFNIGGNYKKSGMYFEVLNYGIEGICAS